MAIRIGRWFRRRGHFEGGLHLPSRSAATAGLPIADLDAPSDVWIPLHIHDTDARPLVEAGHRVRAGQVIAESADGFRIHASINGVIAGITKVDTARRLDVPAVRIARCGPAGGTTDGAEGRPGDATACLARPCLTSQTVPLGQTDLDQFALSLNRAGVTDAGRPLGELLRAATGRAKDLVINGLDPEPVLSHTSQLVFEHIVEIIRGASTLRSAIGVKHIWLVIDRADVGLLSACRRVCKGTPLRLLAIRPKYPQSHPKLLAHMVTNRETPIGASTLAIGVLVLDAATVLAAERAVSAGEPAITRIVTVTGPAITTPGHYRVPIGTRVRDILAHAGVTGRLSRVLDGGLLAGRAFETLDAVVTCETAGVVAIDQENDLVYRPGPCIRCGWCQDDCPVGLDPMTLLSAYERGSAAGRLLRPETCIECGLCSYVCPSQLPLAHAVRQLKHQLIAATSSTRTEVAHA